MPALWSVVFTKPCNIHKLHPQAVYYHPALYVQKMIHKHKLPLK